MEECSRCGKDMENKSGIGNIYGFCLNVKMNRKTNEYEKNQFGRYLPGSYTICIECLLEMMGIPDIVESAMLNQKNKEE